MSEKLFIFSIAFIIKDPLQRGAVLNQPVRLVESQLPRELESFQIQFILVFRHALPPQQLINLANHRCWINEKRYVIRNYKGNF